MSKEIKYLTDCDLCRKNPSKEIKELQEVFCINDDEIENGRALTIFEGDPDYIKTNQENNRGNIIFVTYETDNKIYIISNMELDIIDKEIVGWWLSGAEGDKIDPFSDNNNWNYWYNKVKKGIAYRGGSGYVYSLYAKEII